MIQPKINFYGIWPELEGEIKKQLKGFNYHVHNQNLDSKNLDSETEILVLFVESTVDKKIITALPKLKMIAAMSTGYDHIDLKTAQEKNIIVCNVPSYGEVTVAEHTFALLLALSRKIFPSIKRVKEGRYDFHGLRGIDLEGKNLGIIGTGKIGIQVIKRAHAFDMHILAHDVYQNKHATRQFDFSYTSLEKLLKNSDFISLHLPLLPSTKHIINKKNIKLVKKGSYIINTARGALIDPEALLYALNSDILNGAALDVLEDENLIQNEEKLIQNNIKPPKLRTTLMNNMLIDHPKVIVTPHNAFNSTEALQRIIQTTIENIKGFLNHEIINQVHI